MAIQVPDKKVGMKVDWDPYIAFFEFVQRRHLFYSVPTHEYQGWMQTQTTSGSTLRLAAQFGITQSPISRVRERARPGGRPTCRPGRHTETAPGEDLSNSKILKVPDICIGPAHRTPRGRIVRLSLSTMVSGTTPYVPK